MWIAPTTLVFGTSFHAEKRERSIIKDRKQQWRRKLLVEQLEDRRMLSFGQFDAPHMSHDIAFQDNLAPIVAQSPRVVGDPIERRAAAGKALFDFHSPQDLEQPFPFPHFGLPSETVLGPESHKTGHASGYETAMHRQTARRHDGWDLTAFAPDTGSIHTAAHFPYGSRAIFSPQQSEYSLASQSIPQNDLPSFGPVLLETGFEPGEGFLTGFLDEQQGWTVFDASSVQPIISDANPGSGTQHMRIAKDPSLDEGTWVGGFSPYLGEQPAGRYIVSVDVNISGAEGADYHVLAQAPSQESIATWLRFDWQGNIFVRDNSGIWSDTNTSWTVGSYTNLTIDLDADADSLDYYYGGHLIHSTSATGATSIEQVIFFGDNWNDGDVGDFDNLSIIVIEDVGDTLATAKPTGIGPVSGIYTHETSIGNGEHGSKDVDMYRFDGGSGTTVSLTTSLPDGGKPMDTILRLFDASGNELALNDNFGGNAYSHIEYTLTTAGTYYVGVSGASNSSYDPHVAGSGIEGSTGDYLLTLEMDFSVPGQIRGFYETGFEPDEGFSSGFLRGQQGWTVFDASSDQPIVTDTNPGSGTQHVRIAKDPDVFVGAWVGGFSPDLGEQPAGRYIVSVDVNISSTGGADYHVVPQIVSRDLIAAWVKFDWQGSIFVLEPDGWNDTNTSWNVGSYTNLSIDLDSDANTISYYYDDVLIHSGVTGATSVERVVIFGDNWNDGDVGDFDNLSITAVDVGDTLAAAKLTGIGPASGVFTYRTAIGDGEHGSKDVDIYRFDAAAGTTVSLTTSLPDGGEPMDTVLRLFDASGSELALNDDFGNSAYSHIEYTFTTAGTYYAGVSGSTNSSYNPNVADSGTDGSTGDYLLTLEMNFSVPGQIQGFKWRDLNGDGVWDAGEPPLADWQIYLDYNNNGQWDAGEPKTTTGGDGSYVFTGVLPGTYTVAEVMQEGWEQTYPVTSAGGAMASNSPLAGNLSDGQRTGGDGTVPSPATVPTQSPDVVPESLDMRPPVTLFTGDLSHAEKTVVVGDPNGTPPVTPADRIDANLPVSPFAGVVSVQAINALSSGSLISPIHVLTAAHNVDHNNDGQIDVSPDEITVFFNHDNPATAIGVSEINMHPDWTGFNNPVVNDDLAILTLASPAPAGVPIYPLDATPFNYAEVIVLAGYGRSGDGVNGYTVNADFFVKRTGQNLASQAVLDDEGSGKREVFLFDFDGPPGHPSGDLYDDGPTLGNDLEVTVGPGDSGGPSFLWNDANGNSVIDPGELTLFGVNTFNGWVGPRSADDPMPAPLFGSYGGGMIVSTYLDWIESVVGSGIYPLPGSHVVTVHPSQVVEEVNFGNRRQAPRVTGAYVRGENWNRHYLQMLEDNNLGSAIGGFRLIDGTEQLANSSAVTWLTVDQIAIGFDQPVTVAADALQVYGVIDASGDSKLQPVTSFVYDQDRDLAVWTLTKSLVPGKFLLALDASKVTGDGFTLDGEWETSVTTYETSGDGQPGGDFHFRFNYLPGDVNHDGVRNRQDWLAARDLGIKRPGPADYWFDVDANNMINPADGLKTRRLGFLSIENFQEPSVPGSFSGSGAGLLGNGPFRGTGAGTSGLSPAVLNVSPGRAAGPSPGRSVERTDGVGESEPWVLPKASRIRDLVFTKIGERDEREEVDVRLEQTLRLLTGIEA